jgi:gas vesicle protein
MKLDAKSIAAIAALLTALAGGVELRVQVGLMAAKVDQIENRIQRIEREVSPSHIASNE